MEMTTRSKGLRKVPSGSAAEKAGKRNSMPPLSRQSAMSMALAVLL